VPYEKHKKTKVDQDAQKGLQRSGIRAVTFASLQMEEDRTDKHHDYNPTWVLSWDYIHREKEPVETNRGRKTQSRKNKLQEK